MTEFPARIQPKIDALAAKLSAGMKVSMESRKSEWIEKLPSEVRWAAELLWPIQIAETDVEAETAIDIIRSSWGEWTINEFMDFLGKNP